MRHNNAASRLEDPPAASPEFGPLDPMSEPDRYSTESLDRAVKAHMARFTLGITPFGLATTFLSWGLHLAGAPGKQLALVEKAARKSARLAVHAGQRLRDPETPPCIAPLPSDRRFDDDGWNAWPYAMIYQGFLLTQQWWYNATNGIDGLSRREEQVVSFTVRQLLDILSPANFPLTNPEVSRVALAEGGQNFLRGAQNLMEDWERAISGKPPIGAEAFRPGHEVACTEGRVVCRTHLMELIQYAPTTERVAAEPILIVPAWIMKYYILDLSAENSLVRWLVGQGFTVFCISWRNPTGADRDLGLDDYLDALATALDAVTTICDGAKVQALGYCLGGTLLAAKAAQMARDRDDRLAGMTLLATQTDFEEAGELQLFISESEVAFLENMMWDQGYLDTKQMAGAFQLLRSNDLVWSRYVREYLLGDRAPMFDLMAWNADATRMPCRMHSEYLRIFYLGNKLAQGQFRIGGGPVALSDIEHPIFCVATTSDHIAPWHSVFKLHLLTDSELTFVLTKGGHNAGIVSEPGREGRHFRILTRPEAGRYLPPENWPETAETRDGSWWPALAEWLRAKSGGEVAPPPMGTPDGPYRAGAPAPGSYVLQR